MTHTQVEWRIVGDEVGTCNCDWACPCQFNDLSPTHGFCEALTTVVIKEGHFGEVDLSGVTFIEVFHWDGPVHLGGGSRMHVFDPSTTDAQREAITAITSGAHGHPFFEIFASVAPNLLQTHIAPISVTYDREQRTAKVVVEGFAENTIEPIVGFTGEPSRIRIDLPNGFEFKQAEIANSVGWHVDGPPPLAMRHERTYTQICAVEWGSDGTTR